MNQCCPTQVVDGGKWLDPEFLSPIIRNGYLQNGVTMDEATAKSIASQICPVLDQCILDILARNVLQDLNMSNVSIEGLSISERLTIDDNVIKNLVTQITKELQAVIKSSVESQVLTGVTLENTSMKGTLTIDNNVASNIVDQTTDLLQSVIKDSVETQELQGVTIENANFKGLMYMDKDVIDHVIRQITPYFQDEIKQSIESQGLNGVTINGLTLTGSFVTTDSTALQIVNELKGQMVDAVNEIVGAATHAILNSSRSQIANLSVSDVLTLGPAALDTFKIAMWGAINQDVTQLATDVAKSLKPNDIGAVASVDGQAVRLTINSGTINGGVINNNTGSNNKLTGTQLTNTELTGTVTADQTAVSHLCSLLSKCIQDQVMTVDEIAAVFRDCSGSPLVAYQHIASCMDLEDAKEQMRKELSALDLITGVDYHPQDRELIIRVTLSDGTLKEFTVQLDGLGGQVSTDGIYISGDGTTTNRISLIVGAGTQPTITTGTDLSTNIVGGRDYILGKPKSFIKLGSYIIPTY